MSLVWEMTVDTAIEFFEEATKRGLETEEERVGLLKEFALAGKLQRVYHTKRSVDQLAEDLSQEHRVLRFKKPEDT